MSLWITSPFVSSLKRTCHLGGDGDCLIHRELMIPVEPISERISLYVRHDVEQKAVRLTGIEQRENVGVLQVRGGLDLCEEPLRTHNRSQLWL